MKMTLDKQLLWAAGIVGSLLTIWKGIDMIRKSGERHQELIDTIKALQKSEEKQDELIKELDRKVDILITELAIVKQQIGDK